MKKIWFLLIAAPLLIVSCVKDEQPAPVIIPEDYSSITINEIVSKDITNPYFTDQSGSAADWIELYNKGNSAVNIAGMFITDTPNDETGFQQIPADNQAVTTIPAKGFLVLICGAKDASGNDMETQISDGRVFINFGISSTKDTILALYDPDKQIIDQTPAYGEAGCVIGLPEDQSTGRTTDGGPDWAYLSEKTPGAANSSGGESTEGELVVNEFMASNDTFWPGPNDDYADWIEIYNTGDTPIDIGGWYFTDDLADPMKSQVPADNPTATTIPAHGFMVFYADGVGGTPNTLAFKLSAAGESIGLSEDGIIFKQSIEFGTGGIVEAPPTDSSAGLDTDGGTAWMIFTPGTSRPPTPGASNQ